MTHPLDRRRTARPKPSTHHTFRNTSPAEDGLPNAIWLLRPSWRALMLNLREVAKLALIPAFFVVATILTWLLANSRDGTTLEAVFRGLSGVAVLGSFIGGLAVMPAFGLIQLRSSRAEVAMAADEFAIGLPLIWRFTLVNLLIGLLAMAGTLLLIIPGLFVQQRFQLAPYFVLDKEMGVLQAMRASAALGRRYKRPLWSLAILMFVSRVIVFIPVAGIVLSPVLQILYAYAPAVRYIEVIESERRRK